MEIRIAGLCNHDEPVPADVEDEVVLRISRDEVPADVEEHVYDKAACLVMNWAAKLEVYMEFLYVSAMCVDEGSDFEDASHRVRRIPGEEVEDGLHNDLSAPRPDPSWGLEHIWSFHMCPRPASTSRAKSTKFGIVAPAFVCDGVEDRFYGNEHPVHHDMRCRA